MEEANGGELQAAEGRAEHQQRDDGEDAGQGQDAQGGWGDGVGGDDSELHQRDGEENGGLDEQRVQRVDVHFLAHQPIESEGAGGGDRNPRKARAAQGQVGDGDDGDEDGQPLPAAQAFMEKDHAQDDGEQRVDEITQACLHDLMADYGVDEDQPV